LLVARFLNQGTYNQLAGLCIEYSCAGPSHFAEEAQLRFSAPDQLLDAVDGGFWMGPAVQAFSVQSQKLDHAFGSGSQVALAERAAHGFAAGKRVPYRTAFLTKDLLGSGRSIGACLIPGRSPLLPDWKHREGASSLPALPRIAILPPSPRLVVGLFRKNSEEFTGLALVGPWMLFANPRTLQANSEVSARALISNFLTTGVMECKSVFGTSLLRAQSSDWSHGSYFPRAGAGRWKLLLSR
jgi:hypothetical protein